MAPVTMPLPFMGMLTLAGVTALEQLEVIGNIVPPTTDPPHVLPLGTITTGKLAPL